MNTKIVLLTIVTILFQYGKGATSYVKLLHTLTLNADCIVPGKNRDKSSPKQYGIRYETRYTCLEDSKIVRERMENL